MGIFAKPRQATEFETNPPGCDRCNATAVAMLTRVSLQLVFCGHHYDLHEPGLAANGWQLVIDVRKAVRR